ncbi:MAG: hypothetical protein ACR2PC_16080 [Tsuneonella suprasediminis]
MKTEGLIHERCNDISDNADEFILVRIAHVDIRDTFTALLKFLWRKQ